MNHQLPYFYETEVEWASRRRATLRSSGLPELEIGPPPEFQGATGIWTPEHLFVASVNACFTVTFLAIAELSKLDFVSFASRAVGTLEKIEGSGHQITEVVLKPKLLVRHARDLERATRLMQKAEKNCLISNSIKTAVKLEPEINSEISDTLVAYGAGEATLSTQCSLDSKLTAYCGRTASAYRVRADVAVSWTGVDGSCLLFL